MAWKPIETAPHNTLILVLTKTGEIDVAQDGYKPARFVRNSRGEDVWNEEWIWWSNPYTGGHGDCCWDFNSNGSDLTHWQPLPELPK